MEDVNQEVSKLSKINSASLINLRIHNLWLEVNKAAVSAKYFVWNSYLDRIWCELGGDVGEIKVNEDGSVKEPPEVTAYKKLDKEVAEKMKDWKGEKGFSKLSGDQVKDMVKIYNSLINKEFFLRRLMNQQGKGTAYQEEADWD